MIRTVLGSFGLLVIGSTADAKVVTTVVNASYYDNPFTIDVGGGNSLSLSTIDKTFFSPNPAAVQTGGRLEVTSVGAPIYPAPVPSVFRGGSVYLNSPARLLSGAAAGFMPLREAVG